MAKRRVGRNVFEETHLGDLTRKKAAEKASSRGLGQPGIEAPIREKKETLTVSLSAGIVDKARDVVYWSHGLTLAKLVGEAISREVSLIEKARGEPFANRKEKQLPSGRPVK